MSITRLKGGPSLTLNRASTGETTKYTITNFNTPLVNLGSYGEWRITPNSTFYAELLLWGAGGGTDGIRGGAGGFATGIYKFEPGITHVIWVGQGGQSYSQRTQSFGGGGIAGVNGWGFGGGGLTGLFKNSVVQSNSIVIAGAGGGGQAYHGGGGGGGLTGNNGTSGPAQGGSQSAGGNYGGGPLYGGDQGSQYGPGGGSGYFGGGQQGSSNPDYAYGGGGGSSFLHPSLINASTLSGGSGAAGGGNPGNAGSVYRGTAGEAGVSGNAVGQNGRFVLIPVPTPR